MLADAIYWDPSRILFTIPGIDWPVAWYGALFALGFIVSYFILVRMLRKELQLAGTDLTPAYVSDWPALIATLRLAARDPKHPLHRVARVLNLSKPDPQDICNALNSAYDRRTLADMFSTIIVRANDVAYSLVDRLCWFVVAGTVISARLGHVFFYGWDHYRHHLNEIPNVWEGGLASHGAVIGIPLAVVLFVHYFGRKALPTMSSLNMLDLLAAPAVLTGCLIRLGNFINQEIVGKPTDVPWAVLFAHPAEGGAAVPRHPVQLYEGIFYFGLFFVLLWIWRQGWHRKRPGVILGAFFAFVFSWRILIEFFKAQQGGIFGEAWLQTGQMLSIPVVCIGLWLLLRRPPVQSSHISHPLHSSE